MMKNIFLLLLLVSSISSAQHKIKGTLHPKPKTDWIILYKIEGTKQVFINNASIKSDSLKISKKREVVGTFEITLPPSAKSGAYRVTYATEVAGFVDFFYNKVDIYFILNPAFPDRTISFTKSEENISYKKYLDEIGALQETLDSIQGAVLQNPALKKNDTYKKILSTINKVQNKYLELSKNKYIEPFVKAFLRNNSPEIETFADNYMNNLNNNYFDKIDFSNKTLINSQFLTDRISDYVFYLHYSDDQNMQQNLYKEGIKTVILKIKNQSYQKEIIEYLISQFESSKNVEIIDYLFEKHYNALPETLQDKKFKTEKLAFFATEIGRIAPDFSWTEKGGKMKLSSLNESENYVLVFWSTSCSHCLLEIPQLHTFLKNKKNIKVIAFALEKDAFVWKNFSKTNLYGWHNVLGLKKWENEVAKTYKIVSTPSYFVLNKNKKIIAKPEEMEGLKALFEKK